MESGDGLWVSPVTKHNSGPLLFSLVEQPESSCGGKSKEDVPVAKAEAKQDDEALLNLQMYPMESCFRVWEDMEQGPRAAEKSPSLDVVTAQLDQPQEPALPLAHDAIQAFSLETKTLANLDKNHFLANARKKFLRDNDANLINPLAISSALRRNKQNEISIRLTHEIDIRKSFSRNETMRPDEIREGHREEIRTIQPILDTWTA
ncbi:hypothetical protein HGM15179_016041 [Zosterops borbonicus]|uniref:Uncharacterized protein n=1 Tax=Zosterops borbonicus TaxID=364589 RepID=A0A8K1G3N0_9PASS|nr:hypothetical protein HGM15179_016041 [Zosterops borbonicus]